VRDEPLADYRNHPRFGPKAHALPGNTISRRSRLGVRYPPPIPRVSSPDAPTRCSGPLEVLVGPFTDFSDFLGRLLVIVEFIHMTTCSHMFFFRNRL
jgi:hypothetical protein